MTPSYGFSAAFGWLAEAFGLLRRQPGAVLRAGFALVGIALMPSMLQLLLQQVLPGSGGMLQMLSGLLGLVVMPPALGGFFRLLREVDQGRPAPRVMLWSGFHDGRTAWRLISCNLLYALATVALLVALAYALGGPALFDYLRVLSSLKPDATPADLPPLPQGALLLVVVMLLVALVVTTAQQLAAARIALVGEKVLDACGFGLIATLRNAVPFLALYVPMLFGAALAMGVVLFVAGVVFMALSLVSKALGVLVLGVMLLVVLAAVYALMLAFFYVAWRELSGVSAGAPRDRRDLPPPTHEIAA